VQTINASANGTWTIDQQRRRIIGTDAGRAKRTAEAWRARNFRFRSRESISASKSRVRARQRNERSTGQRFTIEFIGFDLSNGSLPSSRNGARLPSYCAVQAPRRIYTLSADVLILPAVVAADIRPICNHGLFGAGSSSQREASSAMTFSRGGADPAPRSANAQARSGPIRPCARRCLKEEVDRFHRVPQVLHVRDHDVYLSIAAGQPAAMARLPLWGPLVRHTQVALPRLDRPPRFLSRLSGFPRALCRPPILTGETRAARNVPGFIILQRIRHDIGQCVIHCARLSDSLHRSAGKRLHEM